jgi:hypothetical protein
MKIAVAPIAHDEHSSLGDRREEAQGRYLRIGTDSSFIVLVLFNLYQDKRNSPEPEKPFIGCSELIIFQGTFSNAQQRTAQKQKRKPAVL